MKLFRSLEFSKLIWLTSEEGRNLWFESDMIHQTGNRDRSSNWWLNSAFDNKRRYIIADICEKQSDSFFEKSIEYNAMQGGRFNPSKSFGTLYTSTNPLVSALEVVYHQFHDAYPLYSNINRNRSKFTSSFNFPIPKKLDFFVTTFEIEYNSDAPIRDIGLDDGTLVGYCEEIGFGRYIGDKFSRDFIFGNDYEVSRLLGSFLHSQINPSFKVPSARIDFEIQDELNIRNVVIPERKLNFDDFSLTGNFYEYRVSVDLELDERQYHPVSIDIYGESEVVNSYDFYLQPNPNKRKNPTQILRYYPNLENVGNKAIHSREVQIQKFIQLS